jgi:hypothetical protein
MLEGGRVARRVKRGLVHGTLFTECLVGVFSEVHIEHPS